MELGNLFTSFCLGGCELCLIDPCPCFSNEAHGEMDGVLRHLDLDVVSVVCVVGKWVGGVKGGRGIIIIRNMLEAEGCFLLLKFFTKGS